MIQAYIKFTFCTTNAQHPDMSRWRISNRLRTWVLYIERCRWSDWSEGGNVHHKRTRYKHTLNNYYFWRKLRYIEHRCCFILISPPKIKKSMTSFSRGISRTKNSFGFGFAKSLDLNLGNFKTFLPITVWFSEQVNWFLSQIIIVLLLL